MLNFAIAIMFVAAICYVVYKFTENKTGPSSPA